MNREHPFELADASLSPTFESSSDLGYAACARQQRAEAMAALIGSAFRGMVGALRRFLTPVIRWEQRRATREALMRCSDRVLADIGIERADIPLVAKGANPAEHQLRAPALQRRWAAARERLDAARAARRERLQVYRELDAYSGS